MTLREAFQRIEQENPEMLDSKQHIVLANGTSDGKDGTLVSSHVDFENFVRLQKNAFVSFYDTANEDDDLNAHAEAQISMVTALHYIGKALVEKMGEDDPIANSMLFTVLKDLHDCPSFLSREFFFIAGGMDSKGGTAIGGSYLSPQEIMAGALSTFEKMVTDELVEKDDIVEMLELSAKAFKDKV